MGKKRIIQKSQEELIKEREVVDTKVQKETKTPASKITRGLVNISSSYNNTIISLCDPNGNIIYWASSGSVGFKGAKKATPFAASKVAEAVGQAMKKIGIQEVAIKIKGVGSGRDSALRSLAARGVEISSIEDVTPIPHNGCRPPKVRRV
ncbi:MAG: 30S ribosomal protein S11 [Candidatus Nealsonbacteria bacterium]|nr:30S ribosomal protein S11 [Candidatus Nealsonbacteria bacterium]